MEDIDRYSDSAEDLDMVYCFLDFQEIKEEPRKTQNPVMDRLVSKHPAQSASQKPLSVKSDAAGKNKPCPGDDLIYLNTR